MARCSGPSKGVASPSSATCQRFCPSEYVRRIGQATATAVAMKTATAVTLTRHGEGEASGEQANKPATHGTKYNITSVRNPIPKPSNAPIASATARIDLGWRGVMSHTSAAPVATKNGAFE